MAKNRIFANGWQLSVACSDPNTPASGGVVRLGTRTGVALTDEGKGGNVAANTTVDFGPSVWSLLVAAVNAALNVGDPVYYHDGAGSAATLNNVVTGGYFFGQALEALNTNTNGTIQVVHIDRPTAAGSA